MTAALSRAPLAKASHPVDALSTAVIRLDEAGTVVSANLAARRLFGIDRLTRVWLGLTEDVISGAEIAPAYALVGGNPVLLFVQGSAGQWLVEAVSGDRIPSRSRGDLLTGLSDREQVRERLALQFAASRREGSAFSVLCVDLDRFKAVNDTLGHPVGDALLRKVADRLRQAAREEDLVARIGGDEFIIVQRSISSPGDAESLAARLVDLVGRTYVADGHMLNIGASVGVAIAGADGDDPDTLLKNADLALYRAKSDGRGIFRFFEPEMDARMQARRSLELDLRRALALQEFELAYQPQVDAKDSRVVGFEALLRWRHAERGQVSPADFIPVAEDIGLIVPIGEWVLRTACQEAASWPETVSVAVNLSPVQFRAAKIVETVISALAASGLSPTRLELEITESALMDDTAAVLQTLSALRSLGVRISMDDFGTGYSSLSYLHKFPFTKIKIDQSFVRRLEEGADSGAIVRAIISLGSSLGMKTTAEGVETSRQREIITSEGCTEIQGYLTGRPMTAQAAANLLSPKKESET